MPPSPGAPGAPGIGIALIVAAMLVVPVNDAIAKLLSDRFATEQIVWARFLFHLLGLMPLALWRYGPRALWPARPGLQLLRGALFVLSVGLFFAALARMPLADAMALLFIAPLAVTALSPWLLRERIGPRRWAAVVVGFVGALVVLQPGSGVLAGGAPLAVAAGLAHALYLIVTRKLSGSGPALVTLAFSAVVGVAVTSLLVPFAWVTPTATDWLLMAAMGAVAATAHLLVILAYDRAPASLLAPFGYVEIVTATLLGFLLFGDFPAPVTWTGIAIIVASGAYISLREGRAPRRR